MTNAEIKIALATLAEATQAQEDLYLENGGEVTAETEDLDAQISALKDLLTTEGVDDLGRWLKSLEDQLATAKAEKAAADRRVKAAQNSIEYVKSRISDVLLATGTEKVKGTYYSFASTTSSKTSVLSDQLDEEYLDLATEAVRQAGLPGYIDVALKTTGTRIKEWAETHEGEGAGFLDTVTAPSVRFTKPRKAE